ncbi:MAG TPA: hypothetical protein VGD56_06745 [Gemmatirosa sp.]
MDRRRVVTMLAAGLGAGTLGAAALATRTRRGRAARGVLLDFAHARLWWRGERRRVPGHPMQYLLAAAETRAPRAILLTLDGADHDFVWNSAAFMRACRGRPFAVATPYIVSNGGRVPASAYPYTAAELDAAAAAPLAFDVAGVRALVGALRAEFGGAAVYLAAYSAGGHLGWKLALDAPELWRGVALACANFAARGLAPADAPAGPGERPPALAPLIRGFQGALDPRAALLRAQWDAGAARAAARGFTRVSYEVVADAGHAPCADAVVAWCAADLGAGPGHAP